MFSAEGGFTIQSRVVLQSEILVRPVDFDFDFDFEEGKQCKDGIPGSENLGED